MSDLISTQESVAKIVDTAIRKILSGEQKLTKEYEQSVIEAVDVILDTARRERGKAEAQAGIVRCKDCKYYYNSNESCQLIDTRLKFYETNKTWVNDCFCSWAERRTDESD